MLRAVPDDGAQAAGTRVLGISGSLRAGSYNRALLHAARELGPPGMEIEIFEGLGQVPPYNGDVEAEGDPPAVGALKRAVEDADGVLIATPEYNYGAPGVLKNAIDWASRPPRQSVLDRKPVALMGASTGIGGTAQAQLQVRQALAFPGAQTMPEPELLVSRVRDKFDGDGFLVDDMVRTALRGLLEAFSEWVEQVQAVSAAA